MTLATEAAGSSLYNTPILSDVKIHQKYKDADKEFYAHKAVLCTHSIWFLKAFTGNFIEASEAVIEIHDDEPKLFEFMLQFFYNRHEDLALRTDCFKRTEDSYQKYIFLPVRLDGIADKYDAKPLQVWAARILKDNLTIIGARLDFETCGRLIREYYSQCLNAGTAVGTLLAEKIVSNYMDFIKSAIATELIRTYPIFAADVLLVVRPNLWKVNG